MLSGFFSSQESFAQSTIPATLPYHKLGIDVEFPSDWPYMEDNATVTFYPREALLNDSSKPSVFVSIGFIPLPYHNLRIEDFATLVVNALNRTNDDFQLIENHSSTISLSNEDFIRIIPANATEIANLLPPNSSSYIPSFSLFNRTAFMSFFKDPALAYELVYSVDGFKTKIAYTKINDNFAYYTTYASPISQYAYYLPSVDRVLSSLTIDRSDFDALMTCRFFKSNPALLNSINIIEPVDTVVKLLGNVALLSC